MKEKLTLTINKETKKRASCESTADIIKFMDKDPDSKKPEHQELKKIFLPYFKERARFYGMG